MLVEMPVSDYSSARPPSRDLSTCARSAAVRLNLSLAKRAAQNGLIRTASNLIRFEKAAAQIDGYEGATR